jgi:arylsulfatase A-like enzyme
MIKLRNYLKALLVSMPLMVACTGNNSAQHTNDIDKPNIIFFIADDMTPDMFNCLPDGKGKNLTPNIDRLVDEGVVMMGQHVSSTVCAPSRFSCLSGKYASRATSPSFLDRMEENDGQSTVEWNTKIMKGEQNLVALLNDLGYYTGASGKNHVIHVPGWDKVSLTADTADSEVINRLLKNNDRLIQAYEDFGFDFADGLWYDNPDYNGPLSLAKHNMDWSAEYALDFLDQAKDSSFFLYFATTVPHGPVQANRAWNADRRIIPYGVLDPEEVPDVLPSKETIPVRLNEAGIGRNGRVPNDKANLLWLDDVLGALIDKVEENGQLDNTIIVFFSDHGQNAKGTVYQDGTLSPSIIWKSGGFECGSTNNTRVSNIDFTPTLLEFAGGSTEGKGFDGVSFKKVLEGDTSEIHSSLYFEMGYTRGILKENFKYIALRYPEKIENLTLEERQVILDDWNEHLRLRQKEPNNLDPTKPFGHLQIIPGGGDAEFKATLRYKHYTDRDQLYDLSVDPTEQNNLANDPEYAEIVNELKEELVSYLNTLPGNFGEFKNGESSSASSK